MRHIKRYEECDTHVRSGPIEVRHPIFLKEDPVPYPSEDEEDRSYEEKCALEAQAAEFLAALQEEHKKQLLAESGIEHFTLYDDRLDKMLEERVKLYNTKRED